MVVEQWGAAGRRGSSLHDSLRWFLGSYAVAIAGYLGLLAVASRMLGPRDLGAFLVVLTATNLLGQLGLVGVNRAGLREAARLQRPDHHAGLPGPGGPPPTSDPDPEEAAALTALRDGVTAVNLLALTSVSVLTAAGCWLLRGGTTTTSELAVAALTGALVHLGAQQKLCAGYLRGFGRARLAGLLEGRSGGALVATSQLLLVVGVWSAAPGWGLPGALAAMALGYLLPLPLAYAVLRRRWGRMRVRRHVVADLGRVVRRDWRFAVAQAGGYTNSAMDLWLCAALLGPLASSTFGAAQRLAQLVLVPSTSLGTVASPAVARLAAHGDRGRLETLVRAVTTVALTGSVLVALPLVVAPGLVLTSVAGPGYAAGAVVLVLLTLGYVANAVSGLSGITLSMTHHEGRTATVQWCGVGIRAAVCGAGAWAGGLAGLAAASAASTLAVYAMMWTQARRHVGVVTHATLRPHLSSLARTAA